MNKYNIILIITLFALFIAPASAIVVEVTGNTPYYAGFSVSPLAPASAVDNNWSSADAKYYGNNSFPGTVGSDGQKNGYCDPCSITIEQDFTGTFSLVSVQVRHEKYGGTDVIPTLYIYDVSNSTWKSALTLGASPTSLPTLTNGNIYNTTIYFNGSVNTDKIKLIMANAISPANYMWYKTYEIQVYGSYEVDTLKVVSPINNSANNSRSISLEWNSSNQFIPYTYRLSTSPTMIPIISTGSQSGSPTYSDGFYYWNTAPIVLAPNTTYYWNVTDVFNNNATGQFSTAYETPGIFNVQVKDEQTLGTVYSFNTTVYGANGASLLKQTDYGWTNFTSNEVGSGYYTITVSPGSNFTAYSSTIIDYTANTSNTYSITEGIGYSPRTIFATSPDDNVIVYVPSLATEIINHVQFEIADMTGLFPFQDCILTVTSNNTIMYSNEFDGSAKANVYLIQGKRYYLSITNTNTGSEYTFGNYIPSQSRVEQIIISSFAVNQSKLYPLQYNVTYDSDSYELVWSDNNNVMNSVSFSVFNETQNICSFYSTANVGGTSCNVIVAGLYNFSLSFNMTDGTYRNTSAYNDYTAGLQINNTGVSPVDGKLIGTGYTWDFGTFTMPNWVYTWVSVILFIAIIAAFGQRDANLGVLFALVFALIFEYYGVFRPLWDDSLSDATNLLTQTGIMGVTGGFMFLCGIYYIANKDRGG